MTMNRRIKRNYAFPAIAALSLMWPISALPSDLSGQLWRVREESAVKVPNSGIFVAQGSIGDWFKSLRVPGTNISCCNEADCGTIDPEYYRTTATGYEVWLSGTWVPVPDEKVLNRPDNPTGRAVLCAINGRVLCFLPGVLS